ncbi:1-phosphatidylinositol 4,5-bisphosphate phosphodiesterase zeta-1-like [Discoglossus pictus]
MLLMITLNQFISDGNICSRSFISAIISGIQLPPSSLSRGNTADPLLSVEIFGVPADQTKKQTHSIRGNAFNPRWDQTLSFTLRVPQLAMVRFCVKDEISLMTNEFLGQCTVPFTSMTKGYRNIPLLKRNGQTMSPASLFVHVWYY